MSRDQKQQKKATLKIWQKVTKNDLHILTFAVIVFISVCQALRQTSSQKLSKAFVGGILTIHGLLGPTWSGQLNSWPHFLPRFPSLLSSSHTSCVCHFSSTKSKFLPLDLFTCSSLCLDSPSPSIKWLAMSSHLRAWL